MRWRTFSKTDGQRTCGLLQLIEYLNHESLKIYLPIIIKNTMVYKLFIAVYVEELTSRMTKTIFHT